MCDVHDAEAADFCARVLYRASRDAWICGNEAEAERLAVLARQTRLDMTPIAALPCELPK